MSSFELRQADVIVTAVVFGDDAMEVTYIKPPSQTPLVSKMETLHIDMAQYPGRLTEIQDLLVEIIDRAEVAIREFTRGNSFDPASARDRAMKVTDGS